MIYIHAVGKESPQRSEITAGGIADLPDRLVRLEDAKDEWFTIVFETPNGTQLSGDVPELIVEPKVYNTKGRQVHFKPTYHLTGGVFINQEQKASITSWPLQLTELYNGAGEMVLQVGVSVMDILVQGVWEQEYTVDDAAAIVRVREQLGLQVDITASVTLTDSRFGIRYTDHRVDTLDTEFDYYAGTVGRRFTDIETLNAGIRSALGLDAAGLYQAPTSCPPVRYSTIPLPGAPNLPLMTCPATDPNVNLTNVDDRLHAYAQLAIDNAGILADKVRTDADAKYQPNGFRYVEGAADRTVTVDIDNGETFVLARTLTGGGGIILNFSARSFGTQGRFAYVYRTGPEPVFLSRPQGDNGTAYQFLNGTSFYRAGEVDVGLPEGLTMLVYLQNLSSPTLFLVHCGK